MKSEVTLTITPDVIERLIAGSMLFRDSDRAALTNLLQQTGNRLLLAAGDDLMTEGDPAEAIYFVERGALEVRKRGRNSDETHRIARFEADSVVGEVALLPLRIAEMALAAEKRLSPPTQMRLNLTQEMARRLRGHQRECDASPRRQSAGSGDTGCDPAHS